MKKLLSALISVLLALSLCACSHTPETESTTYTVNKYGTDYVVDPENGTIFDGTHTYQYSVSGSSSGYDIDITYPDGSTYWWHTQTGGSIISGSGGWSDDYDETRYVDGRTLCDVIEEDAPRPRHSKNVLLIFILLVLGIFNTAVPQAAWYLEYGWRYKDAEPSDLALGLNRLGGAVAIIAAVILIFV